MSSFYVKKNRKSWTLYEETYVMNVRSQEPVPKESYPTLGFRLDMSTDEAVARSKELNKTHTIERKSAAKAARRAKWKQVIESTFLPEKLAIEFGEKLRTDSFGSEMHNQRIQSHWVTIQELIKELELDASQLGDNSNKIFHYFVDQGWSYDYCNKLLRVMGQWGSFVCRKRGQHYEPIRKIPRNVRQKINEANRIRREDKDYTGNKQSDPLTLDLLQTARQNLSVEDGNWLTISFAFGLRPLEVDLRNFKTEVDDKGTTIVWVYQTKLINLPEKDRWKPIPVLQPIQSEALELWSEGAVERPSASELQDVLGVGFTLYAGRKGFEKWLGGLGENLINISLMLGHQSVDRTLKNYADKKTARYSIKNKAG